MTITELRKVFIDSLAPIYGKREAGAIFYLIAEALWGITQKDYILSPDKVFTGEVGLVLDRLNAGEPVQYVLGRAYFCDMDFEVGAGVLVPRPETEELVRLIAEDYSGASPQILDIGTGSGAIAVSLARLLPAANVSAVDISEEALAIARRNADIAQVDIRFMKADILDQTPFAEDKFDVVVSNPPYVPSLDKESMARNVLEYEPHIALFVDDDRPLIFYEAIADYSLRMLKDGGRLYFEIYEKYGSEMVQMLLSKGFKEIEVVKDIYDKDRIVRCRR